MEGFTINLTECFMSESINEPCVMNCSKPWDDVLTSLTIRGITLISLSLIFNDGETVESDVLEELDFIRKYKIKKKFIKHFKPQSINAQHHFFPVIMNSSH